MVDKKELLDSIGPDGIFYRNPTHIYEGEKAEDQSEIVKAIKGVSKSVEKEVLTYTPGEVPRAMPGTAKLREMDKDERYGYFYNLVRYRPNIFKISLVTGNFTDSAKPHVTRHTRSLQSSKPMEAKELADAMAEIFGSANVASFRWEVTSGTIGSFSSECEVYITDDDEAYASEKFNPVLAIEYYSN